MGDVLLYTHTGVCVFVSGPLRPTYDECMRVVLIGFTEPPSRYLLLRASLAEQRLSCLDVVVVSSDYSTVTQIPLQHGTMQNGIVDKIVCCLLDTVSEVETCWRR